MDKAFLVRLSISQWSARKLDKGATDTARKHHGATDKAGLAVYKTLVCGEALETIKGIAGEARAEHQKRTVPWHYDGPGAIAAAGYPAYKTRMAELEHDYWRAVDRFCDVYAQERTEAKRFLGDLWNETDYPDNVRARFAFDVSCEPMPKSEDFRVAGLSAADQDAITRDIEKRRDEALQNAQGVAWERIAETVGKLKGKVEAFKPANGNEKAQGVFRDSLVENVKELVALLPSLNIAADARLEAIGAEVETELCAYSADNLRDSEAARADVAASAADILAKVQAIWAGRVQAATAASSETAEATDEAA